ncbi:MAG: hypothetical protein KAJ07_00585 [Planctomycetes bacterium]|nr:hypothetical protein [Planctomycetota bacterium]
MKEEDQKYLIGKVGLCFHEWWGIAGTPESCVFSPYRICRKCDEKTHNKYQLDPDSPSDLYGKIWPAFEKNESYTKFMGRMSGRIARRIDSLNVLLGVAERSIYTFKLSSEILTSAPDLALSLLEFFRERDKENA